MQKNYNATQLISTPMRCNSSKLSLDLSFQEIWIAKSCEIHIHFIDTRKVCNKFWVSLKLRFRTLYPCRNTTDNTASGCLWQMLLQLKQALIVACEERQRSRAYRQNIVCKQQKRFYNSNLETNESPQRRPLMTSYDCCELPARACILPGHHLKLCFLLKQFG